ncbi:uncharacterized protein LOC143834340 [Paroedura picta]|uniref:uncharacterized protein LOC143834340 n=1 Tax=Paroedura picta TaxID=143630 RepID=UPI004056D578
MERKLGRTLETSPVEKTLRKPGVRGQFRKVNVTLDLDTANPLLTVSEDRRSVRRGDRTQSRPGGPKRFETVSCVLGSEGFTSGKHAWEVEVDIEEDRGVGGLGWAVGVARESVRRKGLAYACPREGIWVVGKVLPYGFLAFTSPEENLSVLNHEPKKIRVSLDYKWGRVDFFDADTDDLLFTFSSASFSGERVHPYFRVEWPGQLKCGQTALGPCQSGRVFPDLSCSEAQEYASQFVQRGRTSQAMLPSPSADFLCGSPPPTFPECSEDRKPESCEITKPEAPNVAETLPHSGSACHGQIIPHSKDCKGVRPTAEARRAKGRQNNEEETEKMFPSTIETISLETGGHTEPRRVEEEAEIGAAMARRLQPQNHDGPPSDPEGSSAIHWEGTLTPNSPSHEEKGGRVSLKEEQDSTGHEGRDTWLSSENYPLFALIPLLAVLILAIYGLLSQE